LSHGFAFEERLEPLRELTLLRLSHRMPHVAFC
jgi:hypothetical protein